MQLRQTRDERETAVDRTGDQLAYIVMSVALLLIVAYRGLFVGEASWDLMAVVLLGGAVATGYRVWKRVCSPRQLLTATLVGGLAGAVTLVVVRLFMRS
jgi:riboflavin transporter FmnP